MSINGDIHMNSSAKVDIDDNDLEVKLREEKSQEEIQKSTVR